MVTKKNNQRKDTTIGASAKTAEKSISLSKFYDLTIPISPNMPTHPGEPEPEFQPLFTLGKDKVNVTRLVMSSHTGTHVDAPKHFLPDGVSVDKILISS
jgi:kynurenine formamidase